MSIKRTLFCAFLIAASTSLSLSAQSKKRIAILPADNLAITSRGYGGTSEQAQLKISVELKLVDALISRLAGNPALIVLDRSQTQTLEQEQDNKLSERFDPTAAVKLGKLQGVDTLIFVHVDSVDASAPEQNSDKFLYNQITVNGIVHISASAKVIAVDTGSILIAPSSVIEKSELIRQYKELTNKATPVSREDQENKVELKKAGLIKIFNEAIDECTKELAAKLTPSVVSSVGRPIAVPKVVGIEAGKIMINRGANAGMKAGDRFRVVRMADSGFKDPDTNQAIVRKKTVCALLLTDVEDAIALGTCVGDGAQAGDLVIPEDGK